MYLRFTSARAVVACLALIAGLISSWTAALIPKIETALVDRLMSSPALVVEPGEELIDATADVNSIYRVLIHKLYVRDNTKLLVIQAGSTGCPMYENEKYRSEFGHQESFDATVRKSLTTVAPETLADYLTKNQESHPLTGISDLGIAHVLVTDEDLSSVFDKPGIDSGWTSFYQKYPRSSGIVFFSAVGFNRDRTQAFVYAGSQCDGLCGSGQYVLLRKENGLWIIQQQMALWVS